MPYLNTEGMTRFDKDYLKGRLLEETSDIKRSFNDLVNTTAESLKDVAPKKLARFLLYIDDDEPRVRKSKDPEHTFSYAKEFERAESIDEILQIVRPHYSFFNFKVIELIVVKSKLIPDDDPLKVKGQLESYKAEFTKYCKRRVYECPPVYNEMSKSCAIVHCKWEMDINAKFTEESILVFKGQLIKALRLNTLALDLVRVDVGCIQLLWQIPKHLYQHIFPLREWQEKELLELGVIELFCRDYKYTGG